MKKLIVLVLFTALSWMYREKIEIKLKEVEPKVTALYYDGYDGANKIFESVKEWFDVG